MLENNKVVFHQRRHVQPEIKSHLLPFAAPLLNPGLVPIEKSLIVNGSGKFHYDPGYSQADEWRNGMRMVQKKEYSDNHIERGKKSIRPAVSDSTREWADQRKHNLAEATRRSEMCGELMMDKFKKKKFPSHSSEDAPQYDMEGYMGRKQRSGRSIDIMRNGIPVAVEGDKAFKDADREPGFYAKGGIIPGSTIQLRTKTVPGGKGGGLITPKKTGTGKLLTYAEKVALKELEYAKSNVLALSIPCEKGGIVVQSFEQRTGCYLVTPEMEAD